MKFNPCSFSHQQVSCACSASTRVGFHDRLLHGRKGSTKDRASGSGLHPCASRRALCAQGPPRQHLLLQRSHDEERASGSGPQNSNKTNLILSMFKAATELLGRTAQFLGGTWPRKRKGYGGTVSFQLFPCCALLLVNSNQDVLNWLWTANSASASLMLAKFRSLASAPGVAATSTRASSTTWLHAASAARPQWECT